MGRRRHPDLYRAPFPLYSVRIHPESGLVITAGGGGASNTGIKNAMHFLQLERISGRLSASLLHSHDTRSRATMNLAIHGNALAAGQDNLCQVLRFSVSSGPAKPAEKARNTDRGSRKRKSSRSPPEDKSNVTKEESADVSVETLHAVQTDFSPDTLQKSVSFNLEGTRILTGGVDGHVRVWEFPGMKKLLDFKAHDAEIEDVATSPENKIVTIGQDFRCCVWEADQLLSELRWNENLPQIPDRMYRYRACRFGKVEDEESALRLYTVQIPHKRERRPPPCYITKWDGLRFLPLLTQPCGNEVISCLAVSDSGTFLGLGTITGSVAVYISFSLAKLYSVTEAHGIVVTDLSFLPDTARGRELQGDNETALLSVAVDSRCLLHLVPNRRTFPVWLFLALCALLVVVAILTLQHVFPGLL